MTWRYFIWRVLFFIECLCVALWISNACSLFPINFRKFNEIPKAVQDDIAENAKTRLDEYKSQYTKDGVVRRNLMLHLHAQSCRRGEAPPSGREWPVAMVQHFCASAATINWCMSEMTMFKTTDKIFPLRDGFHLDVSVSCYRVRHFSRYIHDMETPISYAVIFLMPLLLYARLWKERDEMEDSEEPVEAPPVPSPPRKRTPSGNKDAPLRHIVSRHENYKKRK